MPFLQPRNTNLTCLNIFKQKTVGTAPVGTEQQLCWSIGQQLWLCSCLTLLRSGFCALPHRGSTLLFHGGCRAPPDPPGLSPHHITLQTPGKQQSESSWKPLTAKQSRGLGKAAQIYQRQLVSEHLDGVLQDNIFSQGGGAVLIIHPHCNTLLPTAFLETHRGASRARLGEAMQMSHLQLPQVRGMQPHCCC